MEGIWHKHLEQDQLSLERGWHTDILLSGSPFSFPPSPQLSLQPRCPPSLCLVSLLCAKNTLNPTPISSWQSSLTCFPQSSQHPDKGGEGVTIPSWGREQPREVGLPTRGHTAKPGLCTRGNLHRRGRGRRTTGPQGPPAGKDGGGHPGDLASAGP